MYNKSFCVLPPFHFLLKPSHNRAERVKFIIARKGVILIEGNLLTLMASAKQAIQGLSHSAGNYAEAVECLRKRFDKPGIIHWSQVKALVEAPSIKSGSGKELRHLHDV